MTIDWKRAQKRLLIGLFPADHPTQHCGRSAEKAWALHDDDCSCRHRFLRLQQERDLTGSPAPMHLPTDYCLQNQG